MADDSGPEPARGAGETPSEESPPPRVCLDPGHPSEPGDKLFEALINRKVAFYLAELLSSAGYETFITVDDLSPEELEDIDFEDEELQSRLVPVWLEQRAALCNAWGADITISIHHNHSPIGYLNHTAIFWGEDAEGTLRHEDAPRLARIAEHHLARAMATRGSRLGSDQAYLRFSLTVLEQSASTAILTEASFYSNPAERRRLKRDHYLRKEAEAIFASIEEYFSKIDEEAAAQ